MSLTVIEVLENALYNVEHNLPFAKPIAASQLKNAIGQLNENPDASAEFDEEAAEVRNGVAG